MPTHVMLAHLTYENLPAAIAYLTNAFGFEEHFRYGEGSSGAAQLHLGDAWIMVNSPRPGWTSPARLGQRTSSLTVFVEDVDEHFTRAKAAGARIVEEVHETEYGEYQYGVEDLDGHHWLFSRHARDVSPEEWGARLAVP